MIILLPLWSDMHAIKQSVDKEHPQPHIWKHSGPDNQLEQVAMLK